MLISLSVYPMGHHRDIAVQTVRHTWLVAMGPHGWGQEVPGLPRATTVANGLDEPVFQKISNWIFDQFLSLGVVSMWICLENSLRTLNRSWNFQFSTNVVQISFACEFNGANKKNTPLGMFVSLRMLINVGMFASFRVLFKWALFVNVAEHIL